MFGSSSVGSIVLGAMCMVLHEEDIMHPELLLETLGDPCSLPTAAMVPQWQSGSTLASHL